MKNNKKLLLIVGICLLVIAFAGVAYALLIGFDIFSGPNTIDTGTVMFSYNEPTDEISFNYNQAISDEDGKVLNDYFDFNVSANATGTVDVGYYIYFTPVEVTGNQIQDDEIKMYLSSVDSQDALISEEEEVVAPTYLSDLYTIILDNDGNIQYDNIVGDHVKNYLIHSSVFNFNNTNNTITHYYRLRMWAESNITITDDEFNHTASAIEREYKFKVNVLGFDGEPNDIMH